MIFPRILLFAAAALASPLKRQAANGTAAAPPTATIQSNGASVTFTGITTFGLDEYLGIPFAKPPIGDLRFAPPQPYEHNATTFNATTHGKICVQDPNTIGFGIPRGTGSVDEDCLTLNVITPSGLSKNASTGGGGVPVLVWIYGGGFLGGTSQIYDLPFLPAAGVSMKMPFILVTLNYRLGILGWGYGKEIAAHGAANLGLRDQTLALKWVKENIASFGGDPGKVTAFGQSAGAVSVANLMLNTKDDLFRGAVMMSGGQATAPMGETASAWQEPYNKFVEIAGCQNATVPDNLTVPDGLTAQEEASFQCLKQLPWERIQNASITIKAIPEYQWIFFWSPSVDGDVIPDKPSKLLESGQWHQVPFISGNTKDEGTGFVPPSPTLNSSTAVAAFLSPFYPAGIPDEILSKLFEAYPDNPALGCPFDTGNETFGLPGQWKQAVAITGDAAFQSRRRYLHRTANSIGLSKTWSYQYVGPVPNDIKPMFGVGHAADVPFWFGFTSLTNYSVPTTQLSTAMMTYLINFAYYLDPNGPPQSGKNGTASTLPTWLPYGFPDKKNTLFLGATNITLGQDDYREDSMSSFNQQQVVNQLGFKRGG